MTSCRTFLFHLWHMAKYFIWGSCGFIILKYTMLHPNLPSCTCGMKLSQVEDQMKFALSSSLHQNTAIWHTTTHLLFRQLLWSKQNFQVICLSNLQVQKHFKQIDHKHLVRRHTYFPNNWDFAHIEKRKGKAIVHVSEGRKKRVE